MIEVDGFRIVTTEGECGLTYVESPDMIGLLLALDDRQDIERETRAAIDAMKKAGWTPEMERDTRAMNSYWGA